MTSLVEGSHKVGARVRLEWWHVSVPCASDVVYSAVTSAPGSYTAQADSSQGDAISLAERGAVAMYRNATEHAASRACLVRPLGRSKFDRID